MNGPERSIGAERSEHLARSRTIVRPDPRELAEEAESLRQRLRIARGLRYGLSLSLGLWAAILWLVLR